MSLLDTTILCCSLVYQPHRDPEMGSRVVTFPSLVEVSDHVHITPGTQI